MFLKSYLNLIIKVGILIVNNYQLPKEEFTLIIIFVTNS